MCQAGYGPLTRLGHVTSFFSQYKRMNERQFFMASGRLSLGLHEIGGTQFEIVIPSLVTHTSPLFEWWFCLC